jgi:hypothetical protein
MTYDETAAKKASDEQKRSQDREYKPNSVTRRIDELSSVLTDALDKGKQLSKLHGNGPNVNEKAKAIEASASKRPSMSNSKASPTENVPATQSQNPGSSSKDPKTGTVPPSQTASSAQRPKDKVTYRGSSIQGNIPKPVPGPKPNSVTRRIDELSTVLADALQKGQELSKLQRGQGQGQNVSSKEAAQRAQAKYGVGNVGPPGALSGTVRPSDRKLFNGTAGDGPTDSSVEEGESYLFLQTYKFRMVFY